MAGTTGLEPATSAVTGQRSNQLSYVPSLSFQQLGFMSHRMSDFRMLRYFRSVATFRWVGHHFGPFMDTKLTPNLSTNDKIKSIRRLRFGEHLPSYRAEYQFVARYGTTGSPDCPCSSALSGLNAY